jgi:hypothetical protein
LAVEVDVGVDVGVDVCEEAVVFEFFRSAGNVHCRMHRCVDVAYHMMWL